MNRGEVTEDGLSLTLSHDMYKFTVGQWYTGMVHVVLVSVIGIKLYKIDTVIILCDWICENVHSSHIQFFNFEDPQNC